nr:protein trichome birefringence-like 14 isoform X3 [Populus alba]
MKGNFYRLKGRHLSVTLLVLTFTTIVLWAWEKNPFVTTLWSAQEQFNFHTSEFVVDAPKGSSLDSLTPNEHVQEKDSNPTRLEESQIPEKEFDASNFTNSVVPETEDGDADTKPSSKIKDCNYSKGRWVADSRWPLYSGSECKQWLSEMWACRLTQRTDFSFEGYRWQPENCKMLEFEKSAFLRRMQDRTIAFIGDSLGRQQFQSLMCMASGGEWREDIENVGKEYGLVKARGAIRPDGWAYRFSNTNTTILYYWSASLADLEPLNITDKSTDVAMHLDRAPAFMRRFLHRFDVLVLNTGHHWNRGKITANRWVMYVNGKPLKDRKLLEIGNAKNLTVHSVARWLDSQLPSHPRLKAFFRTISPRHFRNGDWNTGGNCDNTTPLTGGSEISQDESSDPVIAAAVKGTNITLLDITALSELRDEGHISRYSVKATTGVNDCLHWCLPGIPDTWNELLIAQV